MEDCASHETLQRAIDATSPSVGMKGLLILLLYLCMISFYAYSYLYAYEYL